LKRSIPTFSIMGLAILGMRLVLAAVLDLHGPEAELFSERVKLRRPTGNSMMR
jgi:hypothetical protein